MRVTRPITSDPLPRWRGSGSARREHIRHYNSPS